MGVEHSMMAEEQSSDLYRWNSEYHSFK